jgi:hypothetical protein
LLSHCSGSKGEIKPGFYDADTKEPNTNTRIEVKMLTYGESLSSLFCNTEGCFFLKTDKSIVKLLVSSVCWHIPGCPHPLKYRYELRHV